MSTGTTENIEALNRILEGEEDLEMVDELKINELIYSLYPEFDKIIDAQWSKLRKIHFQNKIAANKMRKSRVQELAKSFLDKVSERTEATLEVLRTHVQAKNLSVQFNKLEDCSQEVLQEVFEDFELLEMLNELEAQDLENGI